MFGDRVVDDGLKGMKGDVVRKYAWWVATVVMLGMAAWLTGFGGLGTSAKAVALPPPPPKPCDFGPNYQCQPINNDASLQRLVAVEDATPAAMQARLGVELCSISMVLTGVELPPTENPMSQRVRRIENLNPGGKPLDPATVSCPVPVRGAPSLPDSVIVQVPVCQFSDGSVCQPVNNAAADARIAARIAASPAVADKLAVLVQEGCAIDRVSAGVWAPPPGAPLAVRWAGLATQYTGLAGAGAPGLVAAEAAACPGQHPA